MPDQGRVEYLVDVCDPCESVSFAYSINGVTVSDFYTPHFMASGVRYSFRGEMDAHRLAAETFRHPPRVARADDVKAIPLRERPSRE